MSVAGVSDKRSLALESEQREEGMLGAKIKSRHRQSVASCKSVNKGDVNEDASKKERS
jgi:hypothetical protein